MHLVVPAARSLRTLYALASDRFWVALAVLAGLIAASKIVEMILLRGVTDLQGAGF